MCTTPGAGGTTLCCPTLTSEVRQREDTSVFQNRIKLELRHQADLSSYFYFYSVLDSSSCTYSEVVQTESICLLLHWGTQVCRPVSSYILCWNPLVHIIIWVRSDQVSIMFQMLRCQVAWALSCCTSCVWGRCPATSSRGCAPPHSQCRGHRDALITPVTSLWPGFRPNLSSNLSRITRQVKTCI